MDLVPGLVNGRRVCSYYKPGLTSSWWWYELDDSLLVLIGIKFRKLCCQKEWDLYGVSPEIVSGCFVVRRSWLFLGLPMHSWVESHVCIMQQMESLRLIYFYNPLSLHYLMIYSLRSLWQVFYFYGKFLSWVKLLVSAMKLNNSLYWMGIIMRQFIKCTYGLMFTH